MVKAVRLADVSSPVIGANLTSKFRGVISVIFGSQVLISLRVHCCKRDVVHFTTLLLQQKMDGKMAL